MRMILMRSQMRSQTLTCPVSDTGTRVKVAAMYEQHPWESQLGS